MERETLMSNASSTTATNITGASEKLPNCEQSDLYEKDREMTETELAKVSAAGALRVDPYKSFNFRVSM